MAHDDFMYSRQEEPRKVFIAELQERLKNQEQKKVTLSPFWRHVSGIVAAFLVMSVILLSTSPEVRAFVIRTFGINDWIAVNEEKAQDYFPFAVPQDIPDGYERRIAVDDDEQEGDVFLSALDMGAREMVLGHIVWHNEETACWMMMTVLEHPNLPEVLESSMERNEYFAERYDWIEVFDVAGVRGVWRLKTSASINNMEIEWISQDNVLHRLETSTACMTQAEFIAVAQSVK